MSDSNSLFKLDKNARFEVDSDIELVSDRKYNLAIGGITVYGLLVNLVTCNYFPTVKTKNGLIFVMIAYFVCSLIGISMVKSRKNVVLSFIGYNFIVIPFGFLLSVVVSFYDPRVVFMAFGVTACVTVIMCCLAALMPGFFLSLGKVLFGALLTSLIVGLILSFVTRSGSNFYDMIVAMIFSLYIGYDWARANRFPKTMNNAIDSACDIYLDVINLFLRVLSIMGRKK